MISSSAPVEPESADEPVAEVMALLAARSGQVQLESGHHGNLWLALDGLFWSAGAVEPLVARLAERIRPMRWM